MEVSFQQMIDLYFNAIDHKPTVLDADALKIFPSITSKISWKKLIATTGRNFAAYLGRELMQDFSNMTADKPNKYSMKICEFMHQSDNFRLFHQSDYLVSDKDIAVVIGRLKDFPKPDKNCNDRIKCIFEKIEAIIGIYELPETRQAEELLILNIRWQNDLLAQFQLLPVNKVMRILETNLSLHQRRHILNSGESVVWGEELDRYYKEFIAQGYCRRTAMTLARKRFCSAHRADDKISSEQRQIPGLTKPSLLKYHNAYLGSLK